MESGTILKVHGEGGEGPKGGQPGNLTLQIRVSLRIYFTWVVFLIGSLSKLSSLAGYKVRLCLWRGPFLNPMSNILSSIL